MTDEESVLKREGASLPHWTQTGATYAVTFRLNDALPQGVMAEWELERRKILHAVGEKKQEPAEPERQRLSKLFSETVDRYLDAGHGKCWLRDKRIAKIVRDALLHFDGERYQLLAWCIMPNHVHAVVQPRRGYKLSDILHSWKSFTARKANPLLQREGAFWQPESYDHLVRDQRDLANQIQYVVQNPDKAGLHGWQWVGRGIGFQPIGREPQENRQDADATTPRAPGQLPSHYAPETPLRLIDNRQDFVPPENQRVGLLAWNAVGEERNLRQFATSVPPRTCAKRRRICFVTCGSSTLLSWTGSWPSGFRRWD